MKMVYCFWYIMFKIEVVYFSNYEIMKYFLQFFVLSSIIGICYGLYLKPINPKNGDLFVGLSLVLLIFITMPIFIFRRWKNKDVKDYMLTKENIEKMRDFNDSK